MFTGWQTATDTKALARCSLPKRFRKPSAMPAGMDRFSSRGIKNQTIKQCIGYAWRQMPPLSEIQRSTGSHHVINDEDGLVCSSITELYTAHLACTKAIKTIVTASSKTRAIRCYTAVAIARMGLTGCSKTAPDLNWLNPLNVTAGENLPTPTNCGLRPNARMSFQARCCRHSCPLH